MTNGLKFTAAEKTLSVAEFLNLINELVDVDGFQVVGEISGFQPHPTGAYFSLKDKNEEAIMNCYMAPYAYRSAGILLEDGMEIKVYGTPRIYKPKGRFSYNVVRVELVGEGSLKKTYDALKKRLEEEGIFMRKRPLPEFIGHIGLITSRTGAVISDFRKNIASLGFSVDFYDARVEGVHAAEEIISGIKWINLRPLKADVLVIIRGGGGLEDLQAFNNEAVARAVFASAIPTICGIGHERDVPIASLAADAAVSTPTAAAVLINNSWGRLTDHLPILEKDIIYAFERSLDDIAAVADSFSVANLFEQMLVSFSEKISYHESYLAQADPRRNLELGYGIVKDNSGRIIGDASTVAIGSNIRAILNKGELLAKVEAIVK